MPRDSSGNYTLPAGNPVITGTVITSDWANDTMSDMGNEMTNSLSRNGQGGMLAPLQFVDGSVNEPGIAFVLEPTLGWYRSGTSIMALAALGDEHLRYDANFTSFSVQQGNNPSINLHPVVAGGVPSVRFRDVPGTVRARIDFDEAGGAFSLQRISDVGALETLLTLTDNGNVNINGPVPFGDDQLTRKDYVDANFAKYLAGYLDTGIHEDYTQNIDDILINSTYLIWTGAATGFPSDFVSTGILVTDFHDSGTDGGTQLLYGIRIGDEYKIWMRSKDANVWKTWKLVVNGNILTFTSEGIKSTSPGNSIVESVGSDGYGSFRTNASGTNTSYIFFRTNNVEKGRIAVSDSVTMVFALDTGANPILRLTRTGILSDIPQSSDVSALTRKDYVDSNPTMLRTGTRLDITNVATS